MMLVSRYKQSRYRLKFLKKKWECIENTKSPRPTRRYRIESKSKVKKGYLEPLKPYQKLRKKINPNAEISMSGSDISALDTIVFENGTAPIPKEQILALIPQVELEMQQEEQAKIDNKNNALSKLQALGLSEAEVKELFKLQI